MMYGTPGGIVLIFGGDVRYLCLAISEPFVSEASVPGKILRVSAKRSEQEKPLLRQYWHFPRSSDEAVRAALLAFHRDDAVRRQDRKAGEAGKPRRCFCGEEISSAGAQ